MLHCSFADNHLHQSKESKNAFIRDESERQHSNKWLMNIQRELTFSCLSRNVYKCTQYKDIMRSTLVPVSPCLFLPGGSLFVDYVNFLLENQIKTKDNTHDAEG